jgi:hypothetical protein
VDFLGSYNAILGRPCYAKFMVIPIYTYLKLKMPGTRGIVTTSGSFKDTYTYKQANCDLASSLAVTNELVELQKVAPQGAQTLPRLALTPSSPSRTRRRSRSMFSTHPSMFASGQHSPTNSKAHSLSFSRIIVTSSPGSLWTCQGSQGKSPSTP